jgi:hypothetical protein
MSYKLYTDKPNKFSCNIEVDGTSLANSKVRLVIESDNFNYMFNGVIYENGTCEVNIPKTKGFLSESNKGLMRLEVIADDVYFEPWSSEFQVKASKKVNVVVAEQVEDVKPKIKVEVNQEPEKKIEKPIVENKKPVSTNTLTKKDLISLFGKSK